MRRGRGGEGGEGEREGLARVHTYNHFAAV